MRKLRHIASLLVIPTLFAIGQVPTSISHNGLLTDSSGTPLTSTVSMTMRFFTDTLAGSEVWHQVFPTVNVKNGIYQLNLDVTGVDFNQQLWLQTEVGGSVLTPRTRITSAPHSLSLRLPYSSTITNSSAALALVNNGPGKAIDGRSNGTAIYGGSNAATGVQGVSYSGMGIRGQSTTGNGVYGISVTETGVYGSSDSVTGVYGWSLVDGGVYGTNATTDNFGYLGGPTYGAYGKHNGTGNYGYLGASNVAVGAYNGGLGSGVRGECANGIGVYGINGSTGNYGFLGTTSYGVYGKALSSGGYAGFFDGLVAVSVLQVNGGSDLAEPFECADQNVPEPGTVVVFDKEVPGRISASTTAFDRTVAGVVSGAGGIRPGITLQQDGKCGGSVLVAIAGRVYCKASTCNGPIRIGDFLTPSPVTGHAMRVTDLRTAEGAVVGKAMSSLENGEGLVLMLVNLH